MDMRLILAFALQVALVHGWGYLHCPDSSWILMGKTCYKAFNGHTRDWYQAKKVCKHYRNGDLVEIYDKKIHHWITHDIMDDHKWYWIGANDLVKEGHFVWGSGNDLSTFSSWAPGEPNDAAQCEDCTKMHGRDGTWHDFHCNKENYWVCQADAEEVLPVCPDTTWTPAGDYCLKAFNDRKSWWGSLKHCNELGGTLVEIFTPKVYLTVKGLLKGDKFFWIGANDKDNEGSFVWVKSGKKLSYAPWDRHQPNNYGTCEDCVLFAATTGRWNDYNCYLPTSYVCQVEGEKPEFECPDKKWTLHEDTCYQAFNDDLLNWDNARKYCQYHHKGDLAEIHDKFTNDVIKRILDTTDNTGKNIYWIGLTDKENENSFKWAKSGIQMTFNSWAPGQPDDYGHCEDCVEMSAQTKLWNDYNCIIPAGYICQTKAVRGVIKPHTKTACLLDGWKLMGDTCVKQFSDFRVTWQNARWACQERGADLVQILDEHQNNFVKSLFKVSTNHWIGIYDKEKNRKFIYVNGNFLGSYTAWGTGEPSHSGANEFCVETSAIGHWNDQECTDRNPFVCQMEARVPSDKIVYECSAGWHLYYDHCVQAFVHAMTWPNARKECQKHGGDLVQVKNDVKNQFVKKLLIDYKFYWLGIYDWNHNGVFATLDNKPLVYTDWNLHEPNNLNKNEHCVEYFIHKRWNDAPCDIHRNFVCEIPAIKKLIPQKH